MPLLDVSDILFDPDFADTIFVRRMEQAIGSNGRNAAAYGPPRRIIGVVTAGGGDTLKRSSDGARTEGSILVHTRFQLQTGDQAEDADLVIWGGRRYVVRSISDYSTYGAGFVAAECELVEVPG